MSQQKLLVNDKVIAKHVLSCIETGRIDDVGYCFDGDPYTIQFRIGSIICRVQLHNDVLSVSYGWNSIWLVREHKITEALTNYIVGSHKELEKVRIPTSLWYVCNWSKEKDYYWHAVKDAPSLRHSLTELLDPALYNITERDMPIIRQKIIENFAPNQAMLEIDVLNHFLEDKEKLPIEAVLEAII